MEFEGTLKGHVEVNGRKYPFKVSGMGEGRLRQTIKEKQPNAKIHIDRSKGAKTKKKKRQLGKSSIRRTRI